jgi:hypothetical protein
MTESATFTPGGYRYVPGPFQYSAGVAAEPGFEVVRVRFASHVPMAEGFQRIEAHLQAEGRPLTAFCACEMRSPGQFDDQGFIRFNREYVQTLARWGIFDEEVNPVARANVCPELQAPAEPGFFAFSYTRPARGDTKTFVIAGSGEAREGGATYEERTVRLGDTSPEGMREKARFVLDEMERRMAVLGFTWADATATQIYTVFDVHPLIASEMVPRGAAGHGLTCHHARPPVVGLDFEMDVRGVMEERVLR